MVGFLWTPGPFYMESNLIPCGLRHMHYGFHGLVPHGFHGLAHPIWTFEHLKIIWTGSDISGMSVGLNRLQFGVLPIEIIIFRLIQTSFTI